MYNFSTNFVKAFETLSSKMIDEICIAKSNDYGCFKNAAEFKKTYDRAFDAVGEFKRNSRDYAENKKEEKFVLEFFKDMFSYKSEGFGSRMYRYLELDIDEESFIKEVLSEKSDFLTDRFIEAVDYKAFWSSVEECRAEVGAAYIIDEDDDADDDLWFYIGYKDNKVIVVENTVRKDFVVPLTA